MIYPTIVKWYLVVRKYIIRAITKFELIYLYKNREFFFYIWFLDQNIFLNNEKYIL